MSEILVDLTWAAMFLVLAIDAHVNGFPGFKWIFAVLFGAWVHWVVADSIAYFHLMP